MGTPIRENGKMGNNWGTSFFFSYSPLNLSPSLLATAARKRAVFVRTSQI
jgi:hypothetical protein